MCFFDDLTLVRKLEVRVLSIEELPCDIIASLSLLRFPASTWDIKKLRSFSAGVKLDDSECLLELLADECSTVALTDELLTVGLVTTLSDEVLACSCLPEELLLTVSPVSTIPFGSLDGLTLAVVAVVPPPFVG